LGDELGGAGSSPGHIVGAHREAAGYRKRSHRAAEEVVDGLVGGFAENVPSGHFDRAFGEPVVLDSEVHLFVERGD
jgi:hypothetical protein